MNGDSCAGAGDAPVCDAAIVAELEALFGRPRLGELLASLRREIDARLDRPAQERERLGRDAHALVSVSGTLGFTKLSQACIALERACLGTEDIAAALSRAEAAAAEARRAVETIRAGLG